MNRFTTSQLITSKLNPFTNQIVNTARRQLGTDKMDTVDEVVYDNISEQVDAIEDMFCILIHYEMKNNIQLK